MRSIMFLIGVSLVAQPVTIQPTDQVSASRDVLNANFLALEAKHMRGNGSPIGNVPCSVSQNLGAIYTRLNAGALVSSLFGCHNTGPGAFAWELIQSVGGGSGGVGSASAGQLLRNVSGSVAGIALATSSGSTSASEVPTMDVVQSAIDAKTVAVDSVADRNKTAFVNASGVAGLKLLPTMAPMVFDAGSSTVSASCVVREALSGGVFTGVHLLSIDSATGADISGSVTVQFATSPATGSTTWTNIGTVALSSASRAADTTLSGWTTTVASGQLVRACITGSPTSVQKLIVSPRFF